MVPAARTAWRSSSMAPLATKIRDHLVKAITGGGPGPMTIGQRFRDRGQGRRGRPQDRDPRVTPLEIRHLHDGRPRRRDRNGRSDGRRIVRLRLDFDDVARTRRSELREARRELAAALDATPEIMMQELPEPRVTRISNAAGTTSRARSSSRPRPLPAFDADLPRNRLGPPNGCSILTIRSRKGHGQSTLGDPLRRRPRRHPRGLRGAGSSSVASRTPRRTRPRLHRIRLGREGDASTPVPARPTGCRRSSTRPASDPMNRLRPRAPARRLTAEMMRDQALAASGLLVEHRRPQRAPTTGRAVGGEERPSVPDEFRRGPAPPSLYTFWKWTSPPPAMFILDAAQRDVCVARRSETATPCRPCCCSTTRSSSRRPASSRNGCSPNDSTDEAIESAFRD